MLGSTTSFEVRALNKVTFGARDEDVMQVQQMGWTAWVEDQLNPPAGDEPAISQFLSGQTMRISYLGQPMTDTIPGWPTIDQLRPLNYLNAGVANLWGLARNVEISVAANELTRIQ